MMEVRQRQRGRGRRETFLSSVQVGCSLKLCHPRMKGHKERKLVNFCTFDMHCAWPCVQRKVNKTEKERDDAECWLISRLKRLKRRLAKRRQANGK